MNKNKRAFSVSLNISVIGPFVSISLTPSGSCHHCFFLGCLQWLDWSPCPCLAPLGPLTPSSQYPRFLPRGSNTACTCPSWKDWTGFLVGFSQILSIFSAPGHGPWCLGASPHPEFSSSPCLLPSQGTHHQSGVGASLLLFLGQAGAD